MSSDPVFLVYTSCSLYLLIRQAGFVVVLTIASIHRLYSRGILSSKLELKLKMLSRVGDQKSKVDRSTLPGFWVVSYAI